MALDGSKILRMAQRYAGNRVCGPYREEIIGEYCLAAAKALQSYADAHRGCNLETYVARRAHWGVLDYLRKMGRNGRNAKYIQYDEHPEQATPTAHEALMASELLSVFHGRERKVVEMMYAGYTRRAIAQHFRVCEQTAGRWVSEIRSKARMALNKSVV